MAGTIEETLASVREQTWLDWEAIVVDDGSTDDTADVVRRFVSEDPRFQVLQQPSSGVSAARNRGVDQAKSDWLVFLDGDDTLAPAHLATLVNAARSQHSLSAVHCGWASFRTGEAPFESQSCPSTGDLFQVFATRPGFVLHSCLVRRQAVIDAGLFDPAFVCCEDWDLWQRVARTGALFGRVPDVLAYYRQRPHSLSSDPRRMVEFGLRVIRNGHAADPRVRAPSPGHAIGCPSETLPTAEVHRVCWCAGLALAGGMNAVPMLQHLSPKCSIASTSLFDALFDGLTLRSPVPKAEWVEYWQGLSKATRSFLTALERHVGVAGLARAGDTALARRFLEQAPPTREVLSGRTWAMRLDLTRELPMLRAPARADRLHCSLIWRDRPIGYVELPVVDGRVTRYVLADAIASQFAWPILGAFLEERVYPDVRLEVSGGTASAWRNTVQLASWPAASEQEARPQLHDQAGWTTFLQEIWDRRDWVAPQFYPTVPGGEETACEPALRATQTIEMGDLRGVPEGAAMAVVMLGGAALGTIVNDPPRDHAQPDDWIRVITHWAGFELCRVAVRELLVGWPNDTGTLSERLAQRVATAVAGPVVKAAGTQAVAAPVPWQPLMEALPSHGAAVMVGRRQATLPGTAASRRAVLPSVVTKQLVALARTHGEPVLRTGPWYRWRPVAVYAPDIVPAVAAPLPSSAPAPAVPPADQDSLRVRFEAIFARGKDPWGYTNDYERVKYEQTVSLLDGLALDRALELACAEGEFTARLAPRVNRLLATDISVIALGRARERCASFPHVEYRQLDLMADELPGEMDLVVCSEVLYYWKDREQLGRTAEKIASALREGGHFLTAHANLVVDEPDKPGFDWDHPFGAKIIGETFSSAGGLRLAREIRTPLYRVHLFQKGGETLTPAILVDQDMGRLPARVADRVLWTGGQPRRAGAPLRGTNSLPILMYHRVSPTRTQESRYSVSLEEFERQVRFLHDNGFRSCRLAEWLDATRWRRPLPGRAVMLTFDDGYRDFREHAWPILERYGFSAVVFLVTRHVGGHSSWAGEAGTPLLDWEEVCRLHAAGVEFGSHTVTHRALPTLTHGEVAREAAASRLELERHLGTPVTAFSYPFGESDAVVRHLIGACGYTLGFGIQGRPSRLHDDLLHLPRIEVSGHEGFEEFVAKLSPERG